MRETAFLIAQFALTYGAFLAFSLSQTSQMSRLIGSDHRRTVRPSILRILGAVSLTSAAVLALLQYGVAFGLLFWLESLSVSAGLVALTLARAPRWLRWLATQGCSTQVGS